jgi:hypothetical protein
MLKTLEVASRPWDEISMDFIEPLPVSNGYDSILVVVDRLTKWAIFVPAKTTWRAQDLAQAFFDFVATQHGLPSAILSDRGSKFVSIFWRSLTSRFGINLRLSTSYQPQTDGQTERTNQSLEHYLRIHCEYKQKDWSSLLGLAAFAYNNSVHSTIKCSPFFANFGYHPRWIEETAATTKDNRMVGSIEALHAECVRNIEDANASFAKHYDKYRSAPPNFEVGDMVLVSMRDIRTKRPAKKLDWKFMGPYPILAKIGSHAYRLGLPSSAKIHDVFNVSRLEPWKSNGQVDEAPPPLIVDGEEEHEIEDIVDERTKGRGKSRRKEYLVRWKGYEGTLEEATWEPRHLLEDTEALDSWEIRARSE